MNHCSTDQLPGQCPNWEGYFDLTIDDNRLAAELKAKHYNVFVTQATTSSR